MVGSIDPRCETVRGTHWPNKVAWLFGARVAETILASGPKSPHQQAGHMDASDPIRPSKKLLWHGGRPHMGPGSRGACHRAGRRPDPLAWPGRRGFCTRALTQFSNSQFQIWFKYGPAFSRRDAPEVLQEPFAQENRGRGECRVPNAPTV